MSRIGPAQPKRAGRLLDVERFERVVAPGATTLLRLSGRLHSRAHSGAAAPESTADACERAQAEHSEAQDRLSAAQVELAEAELLRERLSEERGTLADRVEELEAELLSARAGADELLVGAEAERADAEAR